ncbi:PIN domain-containing protein [Thermus sediminis]|nr:hypothetical protein [Thermus sediminis]
MKPYYLDTSLMLRLLTGDPPELAAQALEVFRGAEEDATPSWSTP